MEVSPPMPFDALPALLREEIFLLLRPSDLHECIAVSTVWRDFIASTIMQKKNTGSVAATYRRVFGKRVDQGEAVIVEDTRWMLVCHDEAEQMLYTLSKPANGNACSLKQYSCSDLLQEINTATLIISFRPWTLQVTAGHLIIFSPFGMNSGILPTVFNLASIPWGRSLSTESGIRLPPDASFHISELLLTKDCIYVVSKNAHLTWSVRFGGTLTETTTHEAFEDARKRPVVVHKLTRQSSVFQDVTKLYPVHEFRVMEKLTQIPSEKPNPHYKDQTCLLHLSNNIINERFILVSCPLHGSYEMFDHLKKASMWHLTMPHLPFENIGSILEDFRYDSSEALAAIRRDYIFIYAERGFASLVSIRDGKPLCQVKGNSFVLSPRYVLPFGYDKNGRYVVAVDSSSGAVSPKFPLTEDWHTTDALRDMPWHHDDIAYGDFENVARRLELNGGPTCPVFQLKGESAWGYGHAMLDSRRMVYWDKAGGRCKISLARLELDLDEA